MHSLRIDLSCGFNVNQFHTHFGATMGYLVAESILRFTSLFYKLSLFILGTPQSDPIHSGVLIAGSWEM